MNCWNSGLASAERSPRSRQKSLSLDDFRGLTLLIKWMRGRYHKVSRLKSVGRISIPSLEIKDLGRGKRGRNRGSEPSGGFFRIVFPINEVNNAQAHCDLPACIGQVAGYDLAG